MKLTRMIHGLNDILHSGYHLSEEQHQAVVNAVMFLQMRKSEDEFLGLKCACDKENEK